MDVPSGVAGFVSLLIQIASGINKLRDILKNAEQAPAELEQLLRELVFLQHLMEGANRLSRDPAFEHCEASCGLFVQGLERLYQKLLIDSEKVKGPKMVKTLLAFRHWKKDVEELFRNIQAAKINLILLTSHRTSQCLNEMMLVNQLHNTSARVSISATATDSFVPSTPPAASSSQSPGSLTPLANALGTVVRKPKIRGNCLSMSCSCSCHRSVRSFRRFWALEYTPLAVFQQTCNLPSCNSTKYGGMFRIALSQLGVRWAASIQFYILAESGKFSMRPCFEMERIVPYTSPGFELIWRCKHNLIGFEAAQKGLIELKNTDPTFPTHVNPDGESYIEAILESPWESEAQFQLLKLFMQDFKMSKGTERPGFLPLCAQWIGEGPHMYLLETLLTLGFDATVADTQNWPELSSPNWWLGGFTPDPFFVEYISMICKHNPEFAGLTPLHEAVLFGSPNSIRNLASRSKVNERNFLGQTPLHFAVLNPPHLEALLHTSPDLDAPDNYGNTALMYAAAENREESVMMLLDAGADIDAQESLSDRTFMIYGARRQHWKLVLNCISRIEALKGKQVAKSWARYATLLFHVTYGNSSRSNRGVSFHQFLVKCGDVNFLYDNPNTGELQNTLLHDAFSISDLDALLDAGFKLINHTNSAGRHPLMKAAAGGISSLVEGLLEAGADIGLKDNWHRTALDHALAELEGGVADITWKAMNTIRILTAHGADLLSRDNCRCTCSPEGCLPGAELMHKVDGKWGIKVHFPVWGIEWVCLVYENKGINGAKTAIASLLRRTKHEEMGMTHLCCRRFSQYYQGHISGIPSCIPDDDIDDILDEESEFIEILEKEMAESTDKEYELLFDEWIRHVKSSLAVLCKEAAEHNQKVEASQSDEKDGPEVDYKNDYFKSGWGVNLFVARYPTKEVKASLADYVLLIEHRWRTSEKHQSSQGDWYMTRIRFLRRALDIMGFSAFHIADEMRRRSKGLFADRFWDGVEVESYIQHFLSSILEREDES